MADEQDSNEQVDESDEASEPLLSFDTADTTVMPHWAEPATGETPAIDGGDEPAQRGSRLFPNLPDDPNMVDTSGDTGFDPVGEQLPPTVEELFNDRSDPTEDPMATGPMALADLPASEDPAPSAPVIGEDTTVIRGLGDDDPVAPYGSSTTGSLHTPDDDVAGSALLGLEASDDPFDQQVSTDQTPGPEIVEIEVPVGAGSVPDVEKIPEAAMDDDFPEAPDVSALFDDEVAPTAAPLGETERVPLGSSDTDAPESEGLDAWADLDTPAPHWREGSQDYEERPVAQDDERTVLHFDDTRGGGGDKRGDPPVPPEGGRNVPAAIAVGVTLAALFFGLLSVGSAATMALVTVALVLAAAELFQSVRNVGYRPATLLGMAAVGGTALAAYWKGVEAYPLILALLTVAGLLWFLLGVEAEHATANLAITMLGVVWVGVLGSFAALLLRQPHGDAVLIGAVVGTVAYDVGGYVVGRTTGQSRLAPHISPNKTYEGLIGGMILSVVVTTLVLNKVPGIFPWENMADALWLGVVVAIVAPLGDLAQSLIKRDLGVKDMGSLLPGHGGVFDRFDALLFVLPAAYYVSDVLNIATPAV